MVEPFVGSEIELQCISHCLGKTPSVRKYVDGGTEFRTLGAPKQRGVGLHERQGEEVEDGGHKITVIGEVSGDCSHHAVLDQMTCCNFT